MFLKYFFLKKNKALDCIWIQLNLITLMKTIKLLRLIKF
jgi:hypothetical protein